MLSGSRGTKATQECPCGFLGQRGRACPDTPRQVHAYQARLSGALLDRIDLHVELSALPYAEIDGSPGEPSAAIAARVIEARRRQALRAPQTGVSTNGELGGAAVRAVAAVDRDGRRLLAGAVDRLGVTGRAHDRLLRVARTIADLDGADGLAARHVAEALQLRPCARA